MSTEPYTPTKSDVRTYFRLGYESRGRSADLAGPAFDRFVAKLEADALRRFVESAQDLLDSSGDTRWKARALAYADEVEQVSNRPYGEGEQVNHGYSS